MSFQKISQKDRLIQLETTLGPDVLVPLSFTGTEGMSIPFLFSVEMCSSKNDIATKDIVGKAVTIQLFRTVGQSPRLIQGVVQNFSKGGTDEQLTYYSMEVVPKLSMLARRKGNRIFQSKTIPDIIKDVLTKAGLKDYKLELSRTYQQRDYCTQYDETDLEFITRLMEWEGIYYFFIHEKTKHTLVIADTVQSYKATPNLDSLTYEPKAGPQGGESVRSWNEDHEIRSGKYTLRDYHFELAGSDPVEVSSTTNQNEGDNAGMEIYEYPGGFVNYLNKVGSGNKAK